MAIGANLLVTGPSSAVMRRVFRAMGIQANAKGGEKLRKKVFLKNGVPASTVEADSPAHGGISAREIGSICYDYANDDVYIQDSYVTDSIHTWVKVAT